MIRIDVFWGLYLGPLILGNYKIAMSLGFASELSHLSVLLSVQVPHNQALWVLVIVTVVHVLGKYMTIRY